MLETRSGRVLRGEVHLAIVSRARFLESLLKAIQDRVPGHRTWYHQSNTAMSCISLQDHSVEIRYINWLSYLPSSRIS